MNRNDPLIRLEVRCCCTPRIHHGWLDVPLSKIKPDAVLDFAPPFDINDRSLMPKPSIQLSVAPFYTDWRNQQYLALKDNGATIEQLRSIPGFVEKK